MANFLGNGTQNFNPIAGSNRFITVHDQDVESLQTLTSSLYLSQSFNALPDTFLNGEPVSSRDQMLFGDIGFRYGLSRVVDLQFNITTFLSQQTNREASGAQFATTGLNNIRIGTKYKLFDYGSWGMSAIGSLDLNQTTHNPFIGNNAGPVYNIEAAVGRKWRLTAVAFNFGYRLRNGGTDIPNSVYKRLPDQYLVSFGVAQDFGDRWSASAEIAATQYVHSIYLEKSNEIPTEMLLASHFKNKNFLFNAGGGVSVSKGLFSPDWRVFVGFTFNLNFEARKDEVVTTNSNSTGDQPFAPEEIKANFEIPFDQMMKSHEFRLLKTVGDEKFASEKPPFELIRLQKFDFDFGSIDLRPDLISLINRLGEYLDSSPFILKIRIEGHTDSIGAPERNRIVGQGRADTLSLYLKQRGYLKNIPVESVGYGADRPIADNSSSIGRQENRRVEIRILRSVVPHK